MPKKAKVVPMQEFEPLYKMTLAHAVLTMRAAWQVIDVIKTKEVKMLNLFELFSENTGELVIPIPNKSTHYWFKFFKAAVDCKLITFENLIITIPATTISFVREFGHQINSNTMPEDQQRVELQKLLGKWAKIDG